MMTYARYGPCRRSRGGTVFRATLLMVAHLSVAESLPAQLPPKAPNSSVISLTPQAGYFTEPGIAINPNNPQQIVAVYQDNAHAAYSFDAGRTWQIAAGVESTSYRVSGDVSATYDHQGHAFICYIAFDKLGTFNYWGHNSSRNGSLTGRRA